MVKVVSSYITLNDKFWLELSLKSVLRFVDKVIIIDGGSTDGTLEMIQKLNDERITVISSLFRHDYKGADGYQRNIYLKWLKENCMGWWNLTIDSDEVMSDNGYLLKDVLTSSEHTYYDIHMEHFILHFKLIDATVSKHFVQRRLFKVTDELHYPEKEHNVLEGVVGEEGKMEDITLFHYGYTRGVENIITKFDKHMKKSTMHNTGFLQDWKNKHILGTYPTSVFTGQHPRIVREVFGI